MVSRLKHKTGERGRTEDRARQPRGRYDGRGNARKRSTSPARDEAANKVGTGRGGSGHDAASNPYVDRRAISSMRNNTIREVSSQHQGSRGAQRVHSELKECRRDCKQGHQAGDLTSEHA